MWDADKHPRTHAHNGLLLSHRKEWQLEICDNIDGYRGCYAKWNRSDWKNVVYVFTYIWNPNTHTHTHTHTHTNKRNKTRTVIDIEKKQVVAKGKNRGRK